DRFAHEVSVGRKVDGKVAFDVAAVSVERIGQAAARLLREAFAGDVEEPDPGERAESDLEGAAPIDAVAVRVGAPPAFQLGFDLAQELGAAAQSPRLREQ